MDYGARCYLDYCNLDSELKDEFCGGDCEYRTATEEECYLGYCNSHTDLQASECGDSYNNTCPRALCSSRGTHATTIASRAEGYAGAEVQPPESE